MMDIQGANPEAKGPLYIVYNGACGRSFHGTLDPLRKVLRQVERNSISRLLASRIVQTLMHFRVCHKYNEILVLR